MERNNDGKKSCGSQNSEIATDTRVPWHQLHVTGGWDLDVTPGWQILIVQVTYPSHEEVQRPYPSEAEPAGFPREGGHEGSRCAWLAAPLGDDATTTMLCQRPRTVLLGVSHLQALSTWVQAGDSGEVHPSSYVCWGPPSREMAALPLPISCAIHGARGLHQLGLAKRWDTPSLPHCHQTCDVTHSRTKPGQGRDKADLGLAPVLLPSMRAWDTQFGDILGGSWARLLACSCSKYLLKGKDIKSTVQ